MRVTWWIKDMTANMKYSQTELSKIMTMYTLSTNNNQLTSTNITILIQTKTLSHPGICPCCFPSGTQSAPRTGSRSLRAAGP